MNAAEREQQRFVDCDPELLVGYVEQLITHFAYKTGLTLCFTDGSRLVLELQRCAGQFRLNFAKPFEAVRYRTQQRIPRLGGYAPQPADLREKESE